jgi:hypothetical protein
MPTPERWKKTTLGHILTDEHIARLEQIYQQAKGEVMEMTELVRPWFNEPEMAAHLESKGMLPSFAVYAIPFHYAQARQLQDQQAQEVEQDDLVNRIMGRGSPPPHSQN